VSVRVSYGDLDMSKPTGGETLLKRIEGAARKVCYQAVPRTLLKVRSLGKCRNETIANAVGNVKISTLTMAWNKTQSQAVQLSAR
ncbi:MAG TPA: UrcA family protein, partial [Hyphomonadaceae bacterium]|nr:UrcA family protein [Hyphomonadaceae bacterium]